jgi:hypothetical protein
MGAESPPNGEELIRAIDDLYYAAHQSALFAYWKLVKGPITNSFKQHGMLQAHTYFNNGIAESALLFIRKTTEFFKPKGDRDRPDTLYAYRYLQSWPGTWVIPEDTYVELHKRVGHITVREARYGKRQWQIIGFTARAIDQWVDFFSSVGESLSSTATHPNKSSMDLCRRSATYLVLVTSCRLEQGPNHTMEPTASRRYV